MQIEKEKQFKKCRNCGYLKSFIINKDNGDEQAIVLNRKKIQNCNYYCARNNNYNYCDDFWWYKFFPKDLRPNEAINLQNKKRKFRKNIYVYTIKFIKYSISTIIAFGMLYFAYLNYLK